MDSLKQSYVCFLTKIGLVTNILGFYGYYDKWKPVFCLCSKETKMFWEKNEDGLQKLSRKLFKDREKLLALLSPEMLIPDMNFGKNSTLFFACNRQTSVPDILKQA